MTAVGAGLRAGPSLSAGPLYLAVTASALPFNELRSYAGYSNRPRASPVALRPDRRHRPGMLNRALAVARTLLAIFASRADLILENLALRQQLAVLRRKHPRPRLRASDRLFWLALRRGWPRWKETLAIVQPETVIRWHREGFGRYWRWTSRRRAGRPSTGADIRALVRRVAAENPTWGAPRIHGEIQKLGLEVSERTVSRYMPRRPADPDARQRWRTFLANHREVIAAIDFFTVPTVTFRALYVRSRHRPQREAPPAPSGLLRLVLPRRPHALVPEEGCACGASRGVEAASSRRDHRSTSPWRASSSLRVAPRGLTIPLDQSIAAASSWGSCAFAEGRPPPSLSAGGHDRRRHTQGAFGRRALSANSKPREPSEMRRLAIGEGQ